MYLVRFCKLVLATFNCFSWHFVVIYFGAEEIHYDFLEWTWIRYLHKEKKLGILEIFLRLKLKDKFRKTLRPRYAVIRLHLGYIFHDYCFTVWFQSDFGILWNFINDTLTRWIMLNVYFVFSNFSKGTSVLFSNCFNSTSVSKYQAIYSNNLSWFLPNLLTRNCKGLLLQRAFSHEFLQNIIGKYHVQNADYLGC